MAWIFCSQQTWDNFQRVVAAKVRKLSNMKAQWNNLKLNYIRLVNNEI